MKPRLRLRAAERSSSLRVATFWPPRKVVAGGGLVEAAKDVEQGGLAAAGGAHDADVFAG
jgi:hypothetical protein